MNWISLGTTNSVTATAIAVSETPTTAGLRSTAPSATRTKRGPDRRDPRCTNELPIRRLPVDDSALEPNEKTGIEVL